LKLHDFLYCVPNIERFNVLSEFTSLDLREVEQILNHVAHQVSRRVLDIEAIIQLNQNSVALRGVDIISSQDCLQLFIKVGFQNILSLK